jgi:hypothetical protein
LIVLSETEVSLGEEVEDGSLSDAIGGVAAALLFDAAFAGFELFGAFFGVLSGSVLATLADEVVAGAGATTGGDPASATVDAAELVVAALVSAGSADVLDSVAFATILGAAMTLASM